MSHATTQPHDFQLLDNALDYVLSAAEHAALGTPRDLKYAVLHLFAGVELLLKARLLEEHWSLLFADVDKASQQRLDSGDFKSVDFETAVSRLKDVADVQIDREAVGRLNALRGLRNRIQHFGASINKPQVQSQIGYVANFVIEFVKEHLPELEESHGTQLRGIRDAFGASQAFIDERLKSLAAVLKEFKHLEECPRCLQEAVPIGVDDPPKCRFCDQEIDPSEMAAMRTEDTEVHQCPHCDASACALCIGGDDCYFQCFACGDRMDAKNYSHCPVCSRLIGVEDGICSECLADKVARDNS